jgi:hypothetical protein
MDNTDIKNNTNIKNSNFQNTQEKLKKNNFLKIIGIIILVIIIIGVCFII